MVAGGIQLLTLPIGIVFLKLGFPPQSIILVSFVLETISTVFRMFYFNHLTGYPVIDYFKNVILSSFLSLLPTAILVYFINGQFSNSWINLIVVFSASGLSYLIAIYFIGLDDNDKLMFERLYQSFRNKLSRKSKSNEKTA